MDLILADNRISALLAMLTAVCVGLSVAAHAQETQHPEWWSSGQVIATNAVTTNDYAAANQGQLKWIAWQAYLAMSNSYGLADDIASNGVLSAEARTE